MSQPPPWDLHGQQGQQPYPGEQYGPPGPQLPQDPYQQQPGWPQPGLPPQDPYQQQPGWPPQGQPPYGAAGGQPPYTGPPHGHGKPRKPRGKRHLLRNILIGVGGFIVVSAVVGNISKGGSTPAASSTTAASATPAAAASSAAAAVQASSAPSPPSCTSQVTSWRDSGGLDNLTTVGSDLDTLSGSLTTLGNDMTAGNDVSADEASVQQAAASLQSDDQTAQADLPPSCVPGMRKNVSAGLTDYNKAAIDCNEAITEVSSGNTSVATSDIYAASRAMNAGNGKIAKAAAAVKAFSGS